MWYKGGETLVMRIERLSLKNVGPFDDATLVLPQPEASGAGELVLFEGPNGSGKSTLAEAIAVVIGPPRHPQGRGYEEETLTREPYSRFIPRLLRGAQIEATIRDGDASLVCVARHANPWVQRAGSNHIIETLDCFNDPTHAGVLRWSAFVLHAHMPSAQLTAEGPREIQEDPRTSALSFDKRYRAAERLGQLAINLEFERVQFAQYAAEQPADAERFRAAAEGRRRALRWFEHAFSRLLDRRVTFAFEPGRLSPRMFFDGQEIPLDLLGEGMRATVAWLADLLVRLHRLPWADEARSPWEQDFWLILDEIEASLHPLLQLRILPALRELFPNARIYATTHSPFVVASAADGHIFRLRPDPGTHRVSGVIEPVKLEPGQSLEWVVASIFDTPTGIIDAPTRGALEEHQRAVDALRRGVEVDWSAFLARRDHLVALNDEVAAIVRITEAPVRKVVEAKLKEQPT